MTLDVPTLLIFSAVVVLTSSGMFIAEAWARLGEAVDRLWSLAFASAITTAIAYFAAAVEPELWGVNAVGNAASVLTVWAMWSGIRVYDRLRPGMAVSLGAAAAAAAAVLVEGPAGGEWAGGAVVLAGTALGSLAAAAAIVRGSLRASRPGMILALILTLAGSYYVVRVLVFVAVGPESEVFSTYLGTAVSTIITTVLVNAAAFVAVMLRARQARETSRVGQNFDPTTGVRSPGSFEEKAVREVAAARAAAEPVALVVIAPEEIRAIAVAFDESVARTALVTCGAIALTHVPAHGAVGKDADDEHAFHVLLRGCTSREAVAWATAVRKALIGSPVDVAGGHVRLTASFGIATTADVGYDLAALREVARAAARGALSDGGNRVAVAGA